MPTPIISKSQRKYQQAELLYGWALSIFQKALGPKHSKVTTRLQNYAGLLPAMNRPAESPALVWIFRHQEMGETVLQIISTTAALTRRTRGMKSRLEAPAQRKCSARTHRSAHR